MHALCLADKAASQLLAAVELSNLDGGHPDHMEHVARVLKATVLTLEKVRSAYWGAPKPADA